MSKLKEIHDYLINEENTDPISIAKYDQDTTFLAMEIMYYAHRNQTRENGEPYANHPLRVFDKVFDLSKLANKDLKIPGASEVALLHDVVEDTELTLTDLEEIYDECGMKEYFQEYIKEPLSLITHDKEIEYLDYLALVMKNRTASFVKFCDLSDNSDFTQLTSFPQEKAERCINYIIYANVINGRYHFLEEIYGELTR